MFTNLIDFSGRVYFYIGGLSMEFSETSHLPSGELLVSLGDLLIILIIFFGITFFSSSLSGDFRIFRSIGDGEFLTF